MDRDKKLSRYACYDALTTSNLFAQILLLEFNATKAFM